MDEYGVLAGVSVDETEVVSVGPATLSLIAGRLGNVARDVDLDEAAEGSPDVADRLEGVLNGRGCVHEPWVLEGEGDCLDFVFLDASFRLNDLVASEAR